jgi:hypothetical protein
MARGGYIFGSVARPVIGATRQSWIGDFLTDGPWIAERSSYLATEAVSLRITISWPNSQRAALDAAMTPRHILQITGAARVEAEVSRSGISRQDAKA